MTKTNGNHFTMEKVFLNNKDWLGVARITSCLDVFASEVNSLGLEIPSKLLGAAVLGLKEELLKNGYPQPTLPKDIFQKQRTRQDSKLGRVSTGE